MKGTKKLRLWVLSRGRVPTSRMTHKVYRWVSPDGRSASPPPDPFEVQDQTAISEHTIVNEADERKARSFSLNCNVVYLFHYSHDR